MDAIETTQPTSALLPLPSLLPPGNPNRRIQKPSFRPKLRTASSCAAQWRNPLLYPAPSPDAFHRRPNPERSRRSPQLSLQLPLLLGKAGLQPRVYNQPRSGLPLCRRPERSPKGEATDRLPLSSHFSAFSAQKSHVKPWKRQNSAIETGKPNKPNPLHAKK
jgi:hypothetical protein